MDQCKTSLAYPRLCTKPRLKREILVFSEMAYKDVYILSRVINRLCATVKIKSNYMVFFLGVLCYLLNTYLWPYQVTRESRDKIIPCYIIYIVSDCWESMGLVWAGAERELIINF